MVLYPFAIWLGHGQVEPRFLAGLLLLAGFHEIACDESRCRRNWLAGGDAVAFSYCRCGVTIS